MVGELRHLGWSGLLLLALVVGQLDLSIFSEPGLAALNEALQNA